MRKLISIVAMAGALSGCVGYGPHYGARADWSRYDYNRPDPAYGGYYADRYYRADERYGERVLTRGDRIYRGRDGRYYCRRPDGTTGLVIGAVSGAVLGNLIAPGDSEAFGTIVGAIAGGLLGQALERGEVRCR